MSAPHASEPSEPSVELVLVADASVEGEDLSERLRQRGAAVGDVPLLSLRARVSADRPRVVILDIDAPGAVPLARTLLEQLPTLVLFCVGEEERAREVHGEAVETRWFPRPLDVETLAERTWRALKHPGEPADPPEPPAALPSGYPAAASLPPPSVPSRLAEAGDALDLGALDADEDLQLMEAMIDSPIALSPELAARIEAAERKARGQIGLPSNAPPPSSDDPSGGSLAPPELLAVLDEPLDGGVDGLPQSDAGGSAVVGLASVAPGTHAPGTSSGTHSGGSQFPPQRGRPSGAQPAASSTTRTGVEALLTPSTSAPQPGGSHRPEAAAQPASSPATQAGDALPSTAGEPGTQVGLGLGLPPLRTGGALSLGANSGAPEALRSPRAQSPATGYPLDELLGLHVEASTSGSSDRAPPLRREPHADTMRGDDPSLLGSLSPLSPPVRFREPRAIGGGRAAPSLAPTRPADEPLARVDVRAQGPERPAPAGDDRAPPADRPSTDRNVVPLGVRVSPQAVSVSSPTARETSSSLPAVFGESEGLKPLGQAITSRLTGSLALATSAGLRRVVLQEGDLVTIGSEIADESLVSFLAGRGDIGRDTAARLAGKLPASGRHAGAALIAQGLLAQDDLWPVLRSHAEWLLGRAMISGPGSVEIEPDPPGRLRAEPGVFGGATGAEVFVEVARRVLPPSGSRDVLGGDEARLDVGPKANLLSECALADEELARVRASAGQSLAELCAGLEPEFASVLRALVELGVLAVHAPARAARRLPSGAQDPLDDEAIRQRVSARLALVHEGDYFSLLGISDEATPYEIKRAYLELRRTFEPSRLLTAATVELSSDVKLIAEVLDEAYDVLRDAHRRERYRRAILAGPPS